MPERGRGRGRGDPPETPRWHSPAWAAWGWNRASWGLQQGEVTAPGGNGGGCPGLCPVLGWGRGSPHGGAVLEGSSGERGRAAKQLPFELGC